MLANKKKVGIITLDDYSNYGNRLQNFALTKLLENEQFNVVNGVRILTQQAWAASACSPIRRIVKRVIPFYFVKRRISAPIVRGGLLGERERRCSDFMKSHITVVPPIVAPNAKLGEKALEQEKYDFFIAGSDQIWNPFFSGGKHEFLGFVPKEKRLSFAASIGADYIPAEKKIVFKQYLNEMKYLSVREQRAVEIIKELTGRDADLTMDPTLLLELERWQEAVKKPDIALEHRYICTYFLGEVPEAVKAFAEEKGLPIYALNSLDSPELFTLDPAEFLYMIQNATYVLTDSFHAVAFSLKFNKEFYVFDRKQDGVSSMFSRIETLTKRFGLENRIQNRDRIVEQPPISNWKKIEDELMTEKKKSIEKLLAAMGI